METGNQFLGTERVSKLMRQYAIPCIISLLVGALYNIDVYKRQRDPRIGLQAKAALLRVVRAFLLAARFAFRCAPG